GDRREEEISVSKVMSLFSVRSASVTDQSAFVPPRDDRNAIRSPSGNHSGLETRDGLFVSGRVFCPSASISQTSVLPPARHETKAMCAPSGEKAGVALRQPDARVSSVGGPVGAADRASTGSDQMLLTEVSAA